MNYREILDETRGEGDGSESVTFTGSADGRAKASELDLVMRTGNRWAFPYAYKSGVHFDQSGTITVFFSTHAVSIQGRNLESLYNGILRHALAEIREQPSEFEDVDDDDDGAVVESIVVKEV